MLSLFEHKADTLKAIRAIKEASELFGDDDGFYLKAAVKFAAEFEEWTGFS
jgi:hypothetical protein